MLKILKLKDVRLDMDHYPRMSFDPGTAKRYAEAMRLGETFPAIVVADIGGKFFLVDGMHRLKAHALNNEVHVQVCVDKNVSSLKELYVEAVRLNAKHGRALSRQDKEGIVKKLRELEVVDDEITKLVLAPASSFRRADFSKFRRSVGVKKPFGGRRRSNDYSSFEAYGDVSVGGLLSSLGSAARHLQGLDFAQVNDPDLERVRGAVRDLLSAVEDANVFSGFEALIEEDGPIVPGFGGVDSDEPVFLCSVCGMVEVDKDGAVCGGCENSFPGID